MATLVPFLVGGALVLGLNPDCHSHALPRWGLGLLAGMLFQATVNLLNTWGDERSGVDAVPGAIRTTPQVYEGKVTMRAIFVVAVLCLVLAVSIGVSLCFYENPPWAYRGCDMPPENLGWSFSWTLLLAGIVGALGSINYSTGIKFKYRGLGVPFVSFLMGPLEILVAFAIAAPMMADRILGRLLMAFSSPIEGMGGCSLVCCGFVLLCAPIALLVGAIMHGNDMRDIPTDRAAGIVTLASWQGPRRALAYYRFCHVAPYALAATIAVSCLFMGHGNAWAFMLPCMALPLSVRTMRRAVKTYRENPESPAWCGLERDTGLVHLVFGVFYATAVALLA
jgi:1,4-dihydroxy-2-naphthoate octaprenyltransferase